MEFYQGEIYHIYNRGNIHQKVFYERKNYLYFLKKMKRHLKPFCHILAWCLIPNHFHWLVKVKSQDEMNSIAFSDSSITPFKSNNNRSNSSEIGMSLDETPLIELNKSIGVLLRSYTRAMNVTYGSKGSLFQQRTKSKNLNSGVTIRNNYALICFLYITQNPVKHRLAKDTASWEFSSYRDYAGLRNGRLCNKGLAENLLNLPSNAVEFRTFIRQSLPDNYQDHIF
jgi:putative transposase